MSRKAYVTFRVDMDAAIKKIEKIQMLRALSSGVFAGHESQLKSQAKSDFG